MKSKLISRIIAVSMAACMLFSAQPWTSATALWFQDEKDAKTYLAEVKMFYGETEEKAREYCEGEDYIFCPANLNEGSSTIYAGVDSSIGIYMGYKTTEDPDDPGCAYQ